MKSDSPIIPFDTSLFNPRILDAAKNGELEQVKALIILGADVNAVDEKKDTPLNYAIRIGNFKIVEALLNANANLNSPNENGDTPLCIASSFGIIGDKTARLKILEALIKKGAEVDLANKNDGMKPLHIASELGHVEVVEVLLNNRANIDALNGDGKTSLILAIEKDKTEVGLLLIKKGAGLKLTNGNELGPIQLAILNDNTEVVEAITRKGVTEENPIFNPLIVAFTGYILKRNKTTPNDNAELEVINENFGKVVKALLEGKADVKFLEEQINKITSSTDDNEIQKASDALLTLGGVITDGEQNAGPSASPSSTSSGKRVAENPDNEGPSKKNTGLGGKGA